MYRQGGVRQALPPELVIILVGPISCVFLMGQEPWLWLPIIKQTSSELGKSQASPQKVEGPGNGLLWGGGSTDKVTHQRQAGSSFSESHTAQELLRQLLAADGISACLTNELNRAQHRPCALPSSLLAPEVTIQESCPHLILWESRELNEAYPFCLVC